MYRFVDHTAELELRLEAGTKEGVLSEAVAALGTSDERCHSAVVFGARNLGRATIEPLIAKARSVASVARSEETLAGVTAAGPLAVKADVTDQASVPDVLGHASTAHGRVHLVVSAASAWVP